MTDDELVELVQQASTDELSDETVDRLRERMAHSPALQSALRERLRMDQILAGTIGSEGLSAAQLVELAKRQETASAITSGKLLPWAVCLLVAAGLAGFTVYRLGWLSPRQSVAVARDDGEDVSTGEVDFDPRGSQPVVAPDPSTSDATGAEPSSDGDGPSIVIEAESFVAGNVEIDTTRYGRGIGVIRGPQSQAYFAEYDVPILDAGHYRLSIRYTSDKPRPLTVSIDGKPVTRQAANGDLQSWEPQRQTWSEIGVYQLFSGKARLRLETEEWRAWPSHFFPHVDKLRLERVVDPATLVDLNQQQRPWERPQHLGGPVRPFAAICFDDIARSNYTPSVGDMYRWFGASGGLPYRFTEQRHYDRNCPAFDGWLKLRAPWPSDAMLRLAMIDYKRLKLHFYRGAEGVSLHYFEDRRFSWAAYHATRRGANPRPVQLVLAATDDDRGFRTAQTSLAPVDIRWHDGELILSRGDVRLLSVALDGPPEDVVLEGRAGFRGLAFMRVDGVPPPARQRADTAVIDAPASQSWSGEYPAGAILEKQPDGRVVLTAEPLKSPAWAAMTLPSGGLREVLVQLDAPVQGTGLYLAGNDGKPADMIRFVRDRRSGLLVAAWGPAGEQSSEQDFDPAQQAVAFVSPQPWLKFVYGCGALHCAVSVDGVHWSRPLEPNQSFSGSLTTVGLFCKAGQTKRSIGVRRIVTRELDGLWGLVAGNVRQAAKAFPTSGSLDAWQSSVRASRPVSINADEWQRGCALQSLAAGAAKPLGMHLLAQLLDGAQSMPRSVDDQLQTLEDAAIVANVWDDAAAAIDLSVRYRAIGERAYYAGDKTPYSRIRRGNAELPVVSRHPVPMSVAPLARLELLHAVAERRWQDVDPLCREIRFWRFRPWGDLRADELVDWAFMTARRHLPRAAGESVSPARPEWQPLFEEQLHKQTFNLMAEFHAAVEGQQYRDAAGAISSIGEAVLHSAEGAGVLPDVKDADLFVPLPVAVQLAMRDHPALATAMNEHFGGVAQQRVQRALSEGHVAALQAATLQFHGTPAAATAHTWLGDRALAAGEFSRALKHYEQALAVPTASDRAAVQQRARLAAAMTGRDVGPPAAADVSLGESRFPADEFDALVQQTRNRAVKSDNGAAETPTLTRTGEVPKPGRYQLARVGEFNSRGIDRPGPISGADEGFPVDWFSRQVAVAVDRDLMLVCSRYTTTAFDAQTAAVRWQAPEPSAGDRRTAGVAAHRPLVLGDRVVRRSAPQPGPSVVALDRRNGNVIWRTKFASGAVAASDPVRLGNDLAVLTADLDDRQESTVIALTTIDVESGDALEVRPLVRVQRPWWDQRVGQVVVANDHLFAVLGGVSLCCDASGQLQWVRRDERIPATVDDWTALQAHDPPLIVGERLIVAQPGVRTLDALELWSGRRSWSVVLPDIAELIGTAGGRVIVRTREGLLGIDGPDGRTAWSRPLPITAQILACGSAGHILIVERQTMAPGGPLPQSRVSLLWLDAATNQTREQTVVEGLDERRSVVGPLVASAANRHWLFVARENDRDTRDVFKLDLKAAR